MTLGCFDANVSTGACNQYLAQVETMTRLPLSGVTAGPDKISLTRYEATGNVMTVAAVQQALQAIGFFPGGKVDGICGYRTLSAIRLFQEYVRSVEKQLRLPCPMDALVRRHKSTCSAG